LIDARRIPALDRPEVGLARLIAGAWLPAMAAQEVRSGGEGVGLAVEIGTPIPIAVDRIK